MREDTDSAVYCIFFDVFFLKPIQSFFDGWLFGNSPPPLRSMLHIIRNISGFMNLGLNNTITEQLNKTEADQVDHVSQDILDMLGDLELF